MKVLINSQNYTFTPGYNPHKPSDNGWMKQNQDAFKMCRFGEYQVFVKRFEKETQNIPGYQFLNKTKGRRLKSLPMTYDLVTVNENGKNVTYLFQEVLQGNTLEEVMHESTFSFNALQFARNLYDALQSITNEGFWYTDFVEKNIFVANNGHCYLIDLDSVVLLSVLPNEDSPLISQVNKNYKIAVSTYWYRDTFHYPFTYIKNNLKGDTINYLELFVFIAQVKYYIDSDCSVNFVEAKTRKAIPSYLLDLNSPKTYDIFKYCFINSSSVQNILPYYKLESYIKEVLFPDNETYEIDFHNSRLLSGGTIPKPNPRPNPEPKPKPYPQPGEEPKNNSKRSNIWLWLGGVAAAIIFSLFIINNVSDDSSVVIEEYLKAEEAIISDPDGYTNVRSGKAIDYPELIKSLLKAEDNKDFSDVYEHFSPNIKRYWMHEYPSYSKLKSHYENTWSKLKSSKNYIQNIEKVGVSTYDYTVLFEYHQIKNDLKKSVNSKVRVVFDDKGKILEVYGL